MASKSTNGTLFTLGTLALGAFVVWYWYKHHKGGGSGGGGAIGGGGASSQYPYAQQPQSPGGPSIGAGINPGSGNSNPAVTAAAGNAAVQELISQSNYFAQNQPNPDLGGATLSSYNGGDAVVEALNSHSYFNSNGDYVTENSTDPGTPGSGVGQFIDDLLQAAGLSASSDSGNTSPDGTDSSNQAAAYYSSPSDSGEDYTVDSSGSDLSSYGSTGTDSGSGDSGYGGDGGGDGGDGGGGSDYGDDGGIDGGGSNDS